MYDSTSRLIISLTAAGLFLVFNPGYAADQTSKTGSSGTTLSAPSTTNKLSPQVKSQQKPVPGVSTASKSITTNKAPTKITTPSAVTIQPGAGISNQQAGRVRDIGNNAASVRDAGNIKNMQELEKLQQGAGGAALNGNARLNDPASGTALGGKNSFERNNQPGSRDQASGFNSRECLSDPGKCMGSRGNNSRGGVQAQPGATPGGMTKGGNLGWARDGESNSNNQPAAGANGGNNTPGSQDSQTPAPNRYTDESGTRHTSNGETEKYHTTRNEDGSSRTHFDRTDSKGNKTVSGDVIRKADGSGSTVWINHQNGQTFTQTHDADGNVTSARMTGPNGENLPVPKRFGQGGQPREDGRVSGKNDCNWNPVYGRCMNQRTDSKSMTSQPGRNESGSGGFANPRLGNEAVTNTGGGDFAVRQPGGSGGGADVDPCKFAGGENCGNGTGPGPSSPTR